MLADVMTYLTQPPATPQTQAFEAEPREAELATWVSPDHDVLSVRVHDSPAELLVEPAPIPLWLVAAGLAVPAAALIAWLAHRAMQGGLDGIEGAALAIMLPTALLACAGVLGMVHVLNRKAQATPACFGLDKSRQVLALPRYGVNLPRNRIAAIVEVTGPYSNETQDTRLNHRELSVLARDEQGRFVRYPLKLISENRKAINAGRSLAEELGVPLRVFKV